MVPAGVFLLPNIKCIKMAFAVKLKVLNLNFKNVNLGLKYL